MKKTVAIVGSSGAIGSAFCKRLLEDHSIEKIYKFARNNLDKDSVLLILGKGHEKIQEFKNSSIKFSDQDVVNQYIREDS